MDKPTILYSDPDPLFDQLVARIPEETSRHHDLIIEIGARIEEVLKRKGWTQKDLAKALGKRDSEISKWVGGGHNFTIATIAKIEDALGEDIISVKKYRKTVNGYNTMPESRKRLLNDVQAKYGKK
jgi:transcriptional regulator with XRE-family HTH domain